MILVSTLVGIFRDRGLELGLGQYFLFAGKNNICVHNEISFIDDEVLDVCI